MTHRLTNPRRRISLSHAVSAFDEPDPRGRVLLLRYGKVGVRVVLGRVGHDQSTTDETARKRCLKAEVVGT